MKTKLLFLTLIFILACNVYGQENDNLFARLQGISQQDVCFFNVDGIEITSKKINSEFSAINCEKGFSDLKIRIKDLTVSDKLLGYRNFYVFKSQEETKNIFQNKSYYFVESPDSKLIAFIFASINKKHDKDFERNFIKLVCSNSIPDSIFNAREITFINFAGRKIPMRNNCRWMGVNNVQCPYNGQMNWSVHKDLEDASKTIDNHYAVLISKKGTKVVSEEIVDVVFEGVETTARKAVFDATGAMGLLLSMDGSKRLTVYLVSAPIRGNFVSCVMSYWASDQIKPSGLPSLLEEVMKLK